MSTESAPLPSGSSDVGSTFPLRLLVRDSGRIHVIKVREIEWIEACGNYVQIHSAGNSCLHRGSMKEVVARLSPGLFVRLERSLAVNRNQVRHVETVGKGRYELHMRSGAILPTQRPVGEIRELLLAC